MDNRSVGRLRDPARLAGIPGTRSGLARTLAPPVALSCLGFLLIGLLGQADEALTLHARSRVPKPSDNGEFQVVEQVVRWEAGKTALVICDMWDHHWCRGASARVAEMAPRMNDVVRVARQRGVLILHCPSETMAFYTNTPQRRLAQAAPPATPRVPLQGWCGLDPTREPPLPIDDSDGGCDDWPPCPTGHPWTREIETIDVRENDAVTDSAEAYNLMEQRGIENVIVMGVHLNMCVLGRPFSIRQMVREGKHVLLVRDLTDTMYNSRKRPFVSHYIGTDRMVEHVEKYWCPSITSADFAGGAPFHFKDDRRPRVVILIGEDEYKTWETLPAFAQNELEPRGLGVRIVQADPQDKNLFPGLPDALKPADLLLVSVRRRTPPKTQLDAVRAHLDAGRPLVGIRTACHAFALAPRDRANLATRPELAEWPEFDPAVFGGHYTGHHGADVITRITVAAGAADHPILTGIDPSKLVGHGSLYQVSPLASTTTPLLFGTVPDHPAEPVAWTHAYGPKRARVFYTSLGHPDDFADPQFRRLLLNAILWGLDQRIPP
jgi:type 1 glutamine amidotransferase/nicotinamidase-related amidase